MAFGKRGLKEHEASMQATNARNGSLLAAVQSLGAIMDRFIQAGDGAIGYLCERAEMTGAVAGFDLENLTVAMTYSGTRTDLYIVLGHLEPSQSTDFSEHRRLHSLACSIAAAQNQAAHNDRRKLPEQPVAKDLESFAEPVLAEIVLHAMVMKYYLSSLAAHISTDTLKRAADGEPGIESELEALCRQGQSDLTLAVRRWASRNMAHHDQAETVLMQAKIPMFPFAASHSTGFGSTIRDGIWVPDEHAGEIAEAI